MTMDRKSPLLHKNANSAKNQSFWEQTNKQINKHTHTHTHTHKIILTINLFLKVAS